MTTDTKSIETLVEIVTHEILSVLTEEEKKNAAPQGEYCKVECTDDLCVTTCFNEIGQVINAGADRITSTFGSLPDDLSIAQYIDHTLLKPEATSDQITQLCKEANQYKFASVCINPTNVKLCTQLLKDSPVKVCSVIGFPLGASVPETKAFEAEQALKDGATEIDMVINIGALKDRNLDLVARDILTVVKPVHAAGALLKVIIETALLTDEEKQIACLLAKEAGADFVKTSTGFSTAGATVEDVALMRRTVGPLMGVKAAGGVHSREDLDKMVRAGATRIGASAGVRIVQGDKQQVKAVVPAPKGY
ncbi:MAG: deoxyribose-phosphate aldolase [Anaerolineaceae bacterium]|nr:deoxyribose-phosphate aldolase [Anaerolineaceae bacterium]